MDGKNNQKGYHVGGRIQGGWKQKPWSHDELNVLQLDLFDRTVVKIAGEHESFQRNHSPREVLFCSISASRASLW